MSRLDLIIPANFVFTPLDIYTLEELHILAINNKKCISSELYQNGAVNAERFNDFLKNI